MLWRNVNLHLGRRGQGKRVRTKEPKITRVMNHFARRVCGFLQQQGFFPQPIHKPLSLRFLDFFIDGVSETNFFQCLNWRFGLSPVLIYFNPCCHCHTGATAAANVALFLCLTVLKRAYRKSWCWQGLPHYCSLKLSITRLFSMTMQ